MTLLHAPLSTGPALFGWALLAPALLLALRSVRGGFLADGAQQHAWLAGIAGMALLWTLQTGVGGGPGVGMLGAALYVLLFGAARGLLGLLAALGLHYALSGGNWSAFGVNALLLAVLPAIVTASLQHAIARWLPRNLFVFIIGNGLFVSLAATVVTSLALLLSSLALSAAADAAGNLGEYVGYSLLLAWGEALVSGMIFSALVIFTPGVVRTYREDLYLPPRRAQR